MEGFGFQFICVFCLGTRDALESPELPEWCPSCGSRDPWSGPIPRSRFDRSDAEKLVDSPFYVAAMGSGETG